MTLDMTRVSALLDQMRPHWARVPADMIPLAGPNPAAGLKVVEATNEASRPQLYLYDMIGGYEGVSAQQMVEALASVSGDVDLHVNSPGGIIYEGAAMHNAIAAYQRAGRGSVHAVIDGMAASAASFVVQACATISIEPNATMMVHDGHGLAVGTASVMREAADLLDMLSDTIAEMYAKRGKRSAKDWRAQMVSGDRWYNAAESVKEGLADKLVGDDQQAETAATHQNLLAAFAVGVETPSNAPTTPGPVALEDLRNALRGAFA